MGVVERSTSPGVARCGGRVNPRSGISRTEISRYGSDDETNVQELPGLATQSGLPEKFPTQSKLPVQKFYTKDGAKEIFSERCV